MPSTVALLIGGEARTGKSTFKRHDPVTGALASEAAAATVADAIAAADAAEAAFLPFGGKAGIDALTELRWITIETRPGHFPI
jgi:acyl-CoA reductase-like NAD-dependent aldehyde dehydrogenase